MSQGGYRGTADATTGAKGKPEATPAYILHTAVQPVLSQGRAWARNPSFPNKRPFSLQSLVKQEDKNQLAWTQTDLYISDVLKNHTGNNPGWSWESWEREYSGKGDFFFLIKNNQKSECFSFIFVNDTALSLCRPLNWVKDYHPAQAYLPHLNGSY